MGKTPHKNSGIYIAIWHHHRNLISCCYSNIFGSTA